MCCVPYCNEISKSKFCIPKNNELKSLWEKSLNLKLKPTSKVCEKHFDVNDVIKTWESGKGFSKYTICLKIPKLRPGAIPKLTVVNETINKVLQNAVLDISPPKKRKIHDENSMTYNVLNDHSYSTINDSKSSNNSTSIFEANISNYEHLLSSAITSELETPLTNINVSRLFSVSSTLFEANPLFIYVLTAKFNQDSLETGSGA
ncbi:uncharacterized protein LOC132937715 [Metopolophium dirhodum]|uniref:uncharacterized protein LOC132937715 n=1 Tax=Metopolophium dirhodum TaxID=44670 RepID=UPI00299049F7|nr:uncharacterized protein LOC132937715 [Metopolophium dirhodum]